MSFKISKSEFVVSLFLFVFIVVAVFLQFTNGLSLTKQIDPAYINGTLTANGILLAVLTASVISGGKFLRQIHFTLIKICFLIFIVAVVDITASEVQGIPTLSDYVFLQISLTLTGFVSFAVINSVNKIMRKQNSF